MSKKLKVGLFIDTYFPMIDGVINVVDNYARRLKDICDVIVFCPVGRKDFDDSTLPYKVVRCKQKFPMVGLDYDLPMPNSDAKFKKALEESNLDIVHIHSPFSIGKMGIKYAKKHNIPVVATMHSQFKQDFKKAVGTDWFSSLLLKSVMKAFNACDECWAVNDEIAKIFVEYGAKELPRTQLNGTDIPLIKDEQSITQLKQKNGITEEQKVFVFVGRINIIKNILFIVDSLRLLKDSGMNFKMLFIGDGKDEDKLKAYIKKNKLTGDIIMTGKIKDREEIAKHYKMADLFLFPSLYDASSLVQIEAASQKTPTIFLEGAATAATVQNNVNGYVVENNIEKFANKIIQIFENKEEYSKICENAYRDLFLSWDKVVQKAYKDYLRVIKEFKNEE